MPVIRMVAMESRWLKRAAPSMARRTRLRGLFVRAGARLMFVDESGIEVGVDGHLLAGQRVESEARVTSAVRTAPWLTTMYWMAMRAMKRTNPTM